jgi:hypothetical protein
VADDVALSIEPASVGARIGALLPDARKVGCTVSVLGALGSAGGWLSKVSRFTRTLRSSVQLPTIRVWPTRRRIARISRRLGCEKQVNPVTAVKRVNPFQSSRMLEIGARTFRATKHNKNLYYFFRLIPNEYTNVHTYLFIDRHLLSHYILYYCFNALWGKYLNTFLLSEAQPYLECVPTCHPPPFLPSKNGSELIHSTASATMPSLSILCCTKLEQQDQVNVKITICKLRSNTEQMLLFMGYLHNLTDIRENCDV